MSAAERWSVRRALEDDAGPVATVASAAWRDTYAGLLRAETIEAFLARAYSTERIKTRIAEHEFYVAEDAARIVGFADAVVTADRVDLAAIYVLPDVRGRGAGTQLLHALEALLPLPISADVVAGNRKGEVFYERRGFVPVESIDADLFGEAVLERRWWLRRAGGSPTR